MAHTTGPWHRNIKPASKYPTIFAGRNTHVAQVVTQGLEPEEIEANCNLITAAPDMLEALEHAQGFFEALGPCDDDELPAKINAAIAKAAGQ